jgi:TonB family protein
LFSLIKTITTITKIKRGTQKEYQPFSFFSFIHVSDSFDEDERKAIVIHESVHSGQFHSIDILLYEIAKVLLWWNPFVWMGLNSTKINHEYIADKLASEKAKKYSSVLVAQLLGVKCSVLANNFKSNPIIKKRIMMMKMKKSKKVSVLKYALALPVLALAIIVTTNDGLNASPIIETLEHNETKVYEKVDQMLEFKGGINALMQFLGGNIKYPEAAKKEEVEGTSYISFVIDSKGKINSVKTLKSIHPLLDQEAIRVIKSMPNGSLEKKMVKKTELDTPSQ